MARIIGLTIVVFSFIFAACSAEQVQMAGQFMGMEFSDQEAATIAKLTGDINTPDDGKGDDDDVAPTPGTTTGPTACKFSDPSDNLDGMPKVEIESAAANTWFHRVFNPALFEEPDWDGADSWYVTLALGENSGGSWVDQNNPGQVVYRGTDTHLTWCLGVLTTSKYMDEFLAGASGPVAINVRIAPNSTVTVVTASGNTVSQATSDAGDITVILPDSGVVTISVDYATAEATHESLVWWGPYDRSDGINTIDAR